MASVAPFLACLLAGVILRAAPARADWLWFDDSQPGELRIEANGFTLASLVIEARGVDHTLTNETYDNRDLILPGTTEVRFAGTFAVTEFFLPSIGDTVPGAELVMDGLPENGGEHVSGSFIGQADPALPKAVPLGARVIVVHADRTFPFSTQNLSMLVSLSRAPAGIAEPPGLGVLAIGLSGLLASRRLVRAKSP